MTGVADGEQIARLLFYPQMIRDGVLQPSAFPMDELLARRGKTGASVDRCQLLEDRDALLREKAQDNANAAGGRAPYGFCIGQAHEIRAITEDQNAAQALDVWPDEIKDNNPPKPWDDAHALIRKFDDTYTRANLRGTRDRLSDIFSAFIIQF